MCFLHQTTVLQKKVEIRLFCDDYEFRCSLRNNVEFFSLRLIRQPLLIKCRRNVFKEFYMACNVTNQHRLYDLQG